jgi:hypothetical protein
VHGSCQEIRKGAFANVWQSNKAHGESILYTTKASCSHQAEVLLFALFLLGRHVGSSLGKEREQQPQCLDASSMSRYPLSSATRGPEGVPKGHESRDPTRSKDLDERTPEAREVQGGSGRADAGSTRGPISTSERRKHAVQSFPRRVTSCARGDWGSDPRERSLRVPYICNETTGTYPKHNYLTFFDHGRP